VRLQKVWSAIHSFLELPTPTMFESCQRPQSSLLHAHGALQVSDLRASGSEPYAYRFDRTHFTADLQVCGKRRGTHAPACEPTDLLTHIHYLVQPQAQYKELPPGAEAELPAPVAVAGRIMNKRVMGKLAFLTVRDDRGQIQVRLFLCLLV
jgi:lysyl-tRNA synthetase class 2